MLSARMLQLLFPREAPRASICILEDGDSGTERLTVLRKGIPNIIHNIKIPSLHQYEFLNVLSLDNALHI